MKVRKASQRRVDRQRPTKAPTVPPLHHDDAAALRKPVRSVAGEEDPGAALDAPGHSNRT